MQNNSPAIPRLGIKPYEWWNEALHGVARAGLATVFPQAIGMAASFNDELLYESLMPYLTKHAPEPPINEKDNINVIRD